MKIKLFFLILCCSLSSLVAQVDVAQPTTQIPVEETPEADIENTASESPFNTPLELPDFKPEAGEEDQLDLPIESGTINLDYKRKKSFSMTEKSTLISPGVLFEDRFKNKNQQIKVGAEAYNLTVDKYAELKRNIILGTIKTDSKQVKIVYRDHKDPDGDRIRILVDNEVIKPNVVLSTSYGGFVLTLEPGSHVIDFLALNQGEAGPNTAFIAVYDENGNQISANEWNLATGYKASVVIIKSPSLEKYDDN